MQFQWNEIKLWFLHIRQLPDSQLGIAPWLCECETDPGNNYWEDSENTPSHFDEDENSRYTVEECISRRPYP